MTLKADPARYYISSMFSLSSLKKAKVQAQWKDRAIKLRQDTQQQNPENKTKDDISIFYEEVQKWKMLRNEQNQPVSVRDDFKEESGAHSLRIKNESNKKDEKDIKCEYKISSSKKLKSCLPKIFNQNNNYSESESDSSVEKEFVSSVHHSKKNF